VTGSAFRRPPSWGRWTLGVGAAETGGIAAAAACAGVALLLVGEPSGPAEVLVVLAGAALGGVVEGTLVGWVMHRMLSPWLPGLPRRPFVLATVAVAVTGWVLGNLPPALMSASADTTAAPAAEPPILLIAAVAAAGGALAGVAFGGAQALVLRHHVARPGRWVWANALAWAIGVAIITVGASGVPGGWSIAALALYGAGVGLLAGLVVGAVTGYAVPGLQDQGPRARRYQDRVVLGLLRGPAHRLLSGAVLEFRYTGPRTGRVHALPVQYVAHDGALVVLAGDSRRKRWWRFVDHGAEVDVVLSGDLWHGRAVVLTPGDLGYAEAFHAWQERFPRARPGPDDPVVRIGLAQQVLVPAAAGVIRLRTP
jgi:hypothetical protein